MRTGFTLIELLVVIAIISVLASVVFSTINDVRLKAKDSDRVSSLRSFQNGLESYYIENGNYPIPAGRDYNGFNYAEKNNLTGVCNVSLSSPIHFDNSASSGFLSELYPDYINENNWTDPNEPGNFNSIYNCRYVAPCDEIVPGGNRYDCKELPQYYLLHCHLDKSDNLQENDGGGTDNLYEITGGVKQICVTGTP